MKKIGIVLLFILIGNQSFSQVNKKKDFFLLSDTVFKVGSYCILPDIIFNLSGGCSLHSYSYGNLDSIIGFLKMYPNLVIEIGCYTDCRPIPMTNDTLSQVKARRIIEYFVEKGIDEKRLIAKGYGEHEPRKLEKEVISRGFTFKKGTVLTPEYIKSLHSRQEQEAAHDLNRRTEMKIISLNFKH